MFKAGRCYARKVVHGIMEEDSLQRSSAGVRPRSCVRVGGVYAILLVSGVRVMIKRDCRGHRYGGVRGEILGSSPDQQKRKHLPRMSSLIKNESQRFEDDQIPS